MKQLVISLAVASSAISACFISPPDGTSSQASTSSCAGNVASTCPSVTPSYASDVSPIFFQYCTSCHEANGSQSGKPLDSWSNASKLSSKVKDQVSGCSMPPDGNPQPSAAERDVILSWIACGAPNN